MAAIPKVVMKTFLITLSVLLSTGVKFKTLYSKTFSLFGIMFSNLLSQVLLKKLFLGINRRFLRSMQLGGLGSVLDWRCNQGIRQSKLCYSLRIPPLVKVS